MKSLIIAVLLATSTLAYGQELPDAPIPKINPPKVDCHNLKSKNLGNCLDKKYPDLLQINKPVGSFKEAATGRGMLIFELLELASNVVDEEGTQSCIHRRTCTEGNPLVGNSRKQAYAVGAALGAALIISAVELRKHQHGSAAIILLWVPTTVHTVLAVDGFRR